MPRNNNRGGRNNNTSGKNQYSEWGVMELARERPFTAAATAVGAAAAGLFLWSRRAQISTQISNLSDQVGEWTQNMSSGSGSGEFGNDTAGLTTGGTGASSTSTRSSSSGGSSQRGTSRSGGGNSSRGASSGGSGGMSGTVGGSSGGQSTSST
jgi:hypothetical protein